MYMVYGELIIKFFDTTENIKTRFPEKAYVPEKLKKYFWKQFMYRKT